MSRCHDHVVHTGRASVVLYRPYFESVRPTARNCLRNPDVLAVSYSWWVGVYLL